MATKTIATWALAIQYNNLTAPVLNNAVKSIYNWAGCAIGGFNQSAPGIAYHAVQPFIGTGTSTILATGELVDVQTAALVNGIALLNQFQPDRVHNMNMQAIQYFKI